MIVGITHSFPYSLLFLSDCSFWILILQKVQHTNRFGNSRFYESQMQCQQISHHNSNHHCHCHNIKGISRVSEPFVRKEIGVIGQGKISCLTVLKALNHGRHNRVGHRQYHHQECRKNHHISHQIFFRFLLMYQSFPELSQCSNLAG